MKQIKLFGVMLMTLLATLTFTACTSDDDDDNDNPDNPASLIGNWFEAPTDSVTESFISFRKDGTYLRMIQNQYQRENMLFPMEKSNSISQKNWENMVIIHINTNLNAANLS